MTDKVPPTGWTVTSLASVVAVVRTREDPQAYPALPFVGMDAVEAHTMKILGTVPARRMKSSATRFSPGDILYGRLRPYLNKVVAPRFEGLASAEFIPLTPATGIVTDFVRFRVNSTDFVAFTSHLDEGDRPRVDWVGISRFQLWLPPASEQQRIVDAVDSLLSRLDSAVASLERAQTTLNAYRASVLKAAVEGRLVPTEAELARAENRDYEPADVLLERILAERRRRWEEAELARLEAAGKAPQDQRWKARYQEPLNPNTAALPSLPEGWSWATVDQLTDGARKLAYGVLVPGPDVEGGVRLIRVGDLGDGTVRGDELKRIDRAIADEFSRTYVRGGEILISLVGTIGRTAVVPPHLAGANVARAVGVLPASLLVSARWIELWFRSPRVRADLESKAHEVARKTLNLEDVRSAAVALPPIMEQQRLTSYVEDLDSIAAATVAGSRSDIARCSRLRQAVLKWAFEGKLVDQDPSDEPADRLLERIRAERASSTPTKPARTRRTRAAR